MNENQNPPEKPQQPIVSPTPPLPPPSPLPPNPEPDIQPSDDEYYLEGSGRGGRENSSRVLLGVLELGTIVAIVSAIITSINVPETGWAFLFILPILFFILMVMLLIHVLIIMNSAARKAKAKGSPQSKSFRVIITILVILLFFAIIRFFI